MGTSRAWGRRAARRFPAALCLAAAAVAGLTACDPADGLDTASIAVTTDRTATRALEHEGVEVRWLSCTAHAGGAKPSPGRTGAPSTAARRVADVDCDGRTRDGKDITVNGQVRQAVDGRCVRGDLTARSGGRTVFRATLLGDCNAPPPAASTPSPAGGGAVGGAGRGAGPTVTVTVTVTEHPQGK